jgi:thioredoxin reductase
VTGYGGHIVVGAVTELVQCDANGFWVLLHDGRRFSARRLLVATGLRDELPDIPGLRERWARDVLHCPYCHGYEVRDQPLGVLGGSPDAVRYAQIVRQWADDVVFFPRTGTLTAAERAQFVARAIGIVESPVKQVLVQDDACAESNSTTGGSSGVPRCSCLRGSSPTTSCWSAWAATSTRTAGSPPTAPG